MHKGSVLLHLMVNFILTLNDSNQQLTTSSEDDPRIQIYFRINVSYMETTGNYLHSRLENV